jgi:hypothetical protein
MTLQKAVPRAGDDAGAARLRPFGARAASGRAMPQAGLPPRPDAVAGRAKALLVP